MTKLQTFGVLTVIGALLLMSLITFCLYAADKRKAKKGAWRIPERTLLLMAFLGGGLGALLGMKLLRHKTQHRQFLILVPLGLIVNLLAAGGILYLLLR